MKDFKLWELILGNNDPSPALNKKPSQIRFERGLSPNNLANFYIHTKFKSFDFRNFMRHCARPCPSRIFLGGTGGGEEWIMREHCKSEKCPM